jgi:hypothetical protein
VRLAAWIALLVLVLCGLIATAHLSGNTLPAPERLAQIHLTDCALPCWLGITPGETRYEEAVRRVTAVYPPYDVTVQETQIFVAYLIHSAYGAASIQVTDGVVSSIFLLTSDVDGVTIGDVASLFDAPDCIPGIAPIVLIYNFPRGYAVLVGGDKSDGNARMVERWRQTLNSIEIHSYDHVRNNARCPVSQ